MDGAECKYSACIQVPHLPIAFSLPHLPAGKRGRTTASPSRSPVTFVLTNSTPTRTGCQNEATKADYEENTPRLGTIVHQGFDTPPTKGVSLDAVGS